MEKNGKAVHKDEWSLRSGFSINSILSYFFLFLSFPINPLIIAGIVAPVWNLEILEFLGWFVWAFGMIFVIYPFVYLKIKGDVSEGDTYVKTNKIVKTGLYGIVRHVQYVGGMVSTFFATPLLYQHWIFLVISVPGIFFTYKMTQDADEMLIKKFGKEYEDYMKQVPGIDLLTGTIRSIKRQ